MDKSKNNPCIGLITILDKDIAEVLLGGEISYTINPNTHESIQKADMVMSGFITIQARHYKCDESPNKFPVDEEIDVYKSKGASPTTSRQSSPRIISAPQSLRSIELSSRSCDQLIDTDLPDSDEPSRQSMLKDPIDGIDISETRSEKKPLKSILKKQISSSAVTSHNDTDPNASESFESPLRLKLPSSPSLVIDEEPHDPLSPNSPIIALISRSNSLVLSAQSSPRSKTSSPLSLPSSPKMLRFDSSAVERRYYKPLATIEETFAERLGIEGEMNDEDSSLVSKGKSLDEEDDESIPSRPDSPTSKKPELEKSLSRTKEFKVDKLSPLPSTLSMKRLTNMATGPLKQSISLRRLSPEKSIRDLTKHVPKPSYKYASNIITTATKGNRRQSMQTDESNGLIDQRSFRSHSSVSQTNTLYSDDESIKHLDDNDSDYVESFDFDDDLDLSISNLDKVFVDKRLDLYIIKGINFPRSSHFEVMKSILFIIKLDGYEVSRCPCLSDIIDDKTSVAEFGNECFSIPLKLRRLSNQIISLSENILEIELWHCGENGAVKCLLASIDIRGDNLDLFARGKGFHSSWFTFKFYEQSLINQSIAISHDHLMNEDDHLLDDSHLQPDESFRQLNTPSTKAGLNVERYLSFRSMSRSNFNLNHKAPSILSMTGSFLKRGQSKMRLLSGKQDYPLLMANTSDKSASIVPSEASAAGTVFNNKSGRENPLTIQKIVTKFNQWSQIEIQAVLCDKSEPIIMQEIELSSLSLKNLCYYDKGGNEIS